jgi:glycosyltransferase involved in cell wall biosynthesis
MRAVRILSDIRISQSPSWSRQTDYLFPDAGQGGDRNGNRSLLRRFFRLMKVNARYDVIVTADIKTAQLFGLFRALFRVKKPRHIVLELMLDEAGNDWRWKLKNLLQRLCFSSVDVIFVSSRGEVVSYARRLNLPEGRIRFLPFHTNVVEPRNIPASGDFILSAGKTGRDFTTLAAAVEGLDIRVVVVSDRTHLEGVNFPPNVEVFCNISYEKYLELLYASRLVVVPLKKLVKSTGQVVFLEAMALGKPVIATLTTGTRDYIEDHVTGILVPPENPGELRKAIESLIDNPTLVTGMARGALEVVKEKHTFEAYTGAVLSTAKEISPPAC